MATHVCIVPSSLVQSLQPSNTSSEVGASSSSTQQKFIRLPHPRSGISALFLIDDASNILEVQAVAPDASRSWFTEDDSIIGDGRLLMLTPIDPVFLVLSILLAAAATDKSSSIKFRPLEDIFQDASTHLCPSSEEDEPEAITPDDLNLLASLECTRKAMERTCEYKEITEEITVFRYAPAKLLDVLRTKVTRLSEPAVFDSFQSLTRCMAKDGLGVEIESKTELRQAGRTRAACQMLSQYLPQAILDELLASYDFTALEAHTKSIRESDQLASAPITNRKENDEPKEKKADAKKGAKGGKNASTRGVQQLAKANVQGMAKLSTFFTKKEKTK